MKRLLTPAAVLAKVAIGAGVLAVVVVAGPVMLLYELGAVVVEDLRRPG